MGKTQLLIYDEWLDDFTDMSDAEIGRLVRAAMLYNSTGEDTDFEDRTMRSAFRRMKRQIDDNHQRYANRCETNRRNIRKRWEDTNEYVRIPSNTIEYERIRTHTNDTKNKSNTNTNTNNIYIDSHIPLKDEVTAYFIAKAYQSDPQAFFAYYSKAGWLISGERVRDWRRLADAWEKREKKPPDKKARNFTERDYSTGQWQDLERRIFNK